MSKERETRQWLLELRIWYNIQRTCAFNFLQDEVTAGILHGVQLLVGFPHRLH